MEEFHLPGYDMIPHKNLTENSPTSTGRGSILYIKNSLDYKEYYFPSPLHNFEECVAAEIKINKTENHLCTGIYRRGESTLQNNLLLLDIINHIGSSKFTHKVPLGDFNLPELDWINMTCPGNNIEDYNHKFLECIRDNFLTQHIQEATRQRGGDKPALLDLLFTNEENLLSNMEILQPLGKSDHSIIKFSIPISSEQTKPIIKVQYEKGDYTKFKEDLSKINWADELNKHPEDVNEQWTFFKTNFSKIEIKYVPRKTVYINGKLSKKLSSPLDRKTLLKIKKKNKIWSKMRKNLATEEEKLQYNRIRNQIRKLTRKLKKMKENIIAKNAKTNPKAFWQYSQSKLKNRSKIPDLQIPKTDSPPKFASTDKEKAEVLGEYFSSVFTQEPQQDEMPFFQRREYETELKNIEINEEKILKKLKKLKINKSPGPDNIHPRTLRETAEEIAVPLVIIFKTSLRTKELPKDWKHANVSAVFKNKGKKTLPENYRPVSLTCILCKVMESIIRDHIIDHMKQNNLFSPKQFGFINGRSTVLQLMHVMDVWTEILDEGGCLDVVYCDFMKAFDKVPHNRLIHKVDHYGITGNVLGWVSSFLSNRTQSVHLNGEKSTIAPVTSGIPQGSVLGPILFVLYINDMPEVVDNLTFIFLFADDTKIFRRINSQADVDILQKDIDKLIKWSNIWLLKFHPDKCKYMGIGYQGNALPEKYNMDGQFLEVTDCEKDIGVHIDPKLSFDKHIGKSINKANRILAVIRRTFERIDSENFSFLFKGLVRPHLEYAAPIWSPFLEKQKDLLENVQKRATRFIPGCYNLSYPERLKKLKLPTLAYRRLRGDMIQVFKLTRAEQGEGGYDRSLPELFKQNHAGTHQTRSKEKKDLPIIRCDKRIREHNFSIRVRNIWNSLPKSVIESKNVKAFEKALDCHWQNQELKYDNYKANINILHDKYSSGIFSV